MRVLAVSALVLFTAGCSGSKAPEVKLENDEQKTLYAIGMALSQQLKPLGLTEEEMQSVQAGLADGTLKRDAKVEMQTYGPKLQEWAQARLMKAAESEKAAGADYLKKAAAEPGVTKTESGVIVKTLQAGSGASPKATDSVKVHYHGTLVDGTVFDSSVDRGQPVTIPLQNVIKCWVEGVPQIKVGGKAKLICPPDTAYGERGSGQVIKPGATLVFDVEVLDIVKQ
jgi:FKBP-type peptidyl-prolyl cis-trans isomerase FkpA/FKBP-type peptidyl-prolyl cis-trans isomerase FklB